MNKKKDQKKKESAKSATLRNRIATKSTEERPGNVGKVFWSNSRRIDAKDNKKRRHMLVMKDNGKNVQVSQLKSLKEETKPGKLVEIKNTYKGLTERTGVADRMYNKKAGTQEKLRLDDRTVFDEKPVFELDNDDFHKVKSHVKRRGIKKKASDT